MTLAGLAAIHRKLVERAFGYAAGMPTWEARDPDLGRPIAAPLEQCAALLGVDLASLCEVAADVEPYVRADGTKIWSLMQLERQLHPEAFRRRRGGYIDRRRTSTGRDTGDARLEDRGRDP